MINKWEVLRRSDIMLAQDRDDIFDFKFHFLLHIFGEGARKFIIFFVTLRSRVYKQLDLLFRLI